MKRASLIFGLLLPAVAAAGGCAHTRATRPPQVEAPTPVVDLDQFSTALGRYALIEPGHPMRAPHRDALLAFLLDHLHEALDEGRAEEARSALEYAVGLFEPAELRDAAADPALSKAANRIYARAARRGAEDPAFLALAIRQHFGDDQARADAVRSWQMLEDWVVRNATFSTEPVLRHEELEQALEQAAAVFPSPFLVSRMRDLYVARYKAARQAASHSERGSAGQRRAEFTGYLLIRLYLRADDLQGVAAALEQVDLDMPTRKLAEVVAAAAKPEGNPQPLLALAEQFEPEEGEARMPLVYLEQGYAIVQNLARRAVRTDPSDPFARVVLARTFTREGLVDPAIYHLEKALERKSDIYEAWAQLAALHQESLSRLSISDPTAATNRLPKLERFHQQAQEVWRDRPIEPGLAQAYYSVADGLYHGGQPTKARSLLERSLGVEPVPQTLDLLGTIDLKREKLQAAAKHYEALAAYPFRDEYDRLRWEVRALEQLAEIARRRGKTGDAAANDRAALETLNALLASPQLPDAIRAQHYITRGKILYSLRESKLAVDDFLAAARAAPEDPEAFADPISFLVARGDYEPAAVLFRRALSTPGLSASLKLYFALWIHELAQRHGASPDPEATAFLRSYAGEAWPQKLAAHALGKLTFAGLTAAAKDDGQRAEAAFYEGLSAWRAGQEGRAKELFRTVVESGMLSFFEYDMAATYLRTGTVPK